MTRFFLMLSLLVLLVLDVPAWGQRLASEVAHDSALAPASQMVLIGCEAKDQDGSALPRAVSAEGDAVRCAATLNGVQYMMLVNEDGSLLLHQVEDAQHASGHLGIMPLGVRNDTHTTGLSGADGDYTPLGLDSTGKLGIRGTFAEDSGHTTGDLGLAVWGVRIDTPAVQAGATGDYLPFMMNANGGLVVTNNAPQVSQCKTVSVNTQGVANAGVAVDSTAGGVPVLAASTTRCGAVLYNLQGGGDALCAPTTITVTTTVGFYLAAGQSLALGLEAQQAWNCIRQAGTNATLYVAEETS